LEGWWTSRDGASANAQTPNLSSARAHTGKTSPDVRQNDFYQMGSRKVKTTLRQPAGSSLLNSLTYRPRGRRAQTAILFQLAGCRMRGAKPRYWQESVFSVLQPRYGTERNGTGMNRAFSAGVLTSYESSPRRA